MHVRDWLPPLVWQVEPGPPQADQEPQSEPHGVPADTFMFRQPLDGSHESFVQGFRSLQFRALPPPQLPPAHRSPTVQASPSLQGSVLFVWTQPPPPQESSVQGLPSSQPAGTQEPPQQISEPPQRLVRTQTSPSQLAV